MPNDQQLRADRTVIEQAAAHLRHQAILDGNSGLEHKDLAFALALVLELAQHVRELHPDLRTQTVHWVRRLLGEALRP